jgi:hypothetical protein
MCLCIKFSKFAVEFTKMTCKTHLIRTIIALPGVLRLIIGGCLRMLRTLPVYACQLGPGNPYPIVAEKDQTICCTNHVEELSVDSRLLGWLR